MTLCFTPCIRMSKEELNDDSAEPSSSFPLVSLKEPDRSTIVLMLQTDLAGQTILVRSSFLYSTVAFAVSSDVLHTASFILQV